MTSTLTPTYRVRIEQDDHAPNPRTTYEQTANVITVDLRQYIPIDEKPGPLGGQWRRLDSRYDKRMAMRIFERYARTIHGAAVLLDYPSPDGSRAIWYAMPEALNLAYAPEGREEYGLKVLEAERAEYRTWARGEVVGYVIEKRVTWTNPECGERATWEQVDASWGFYDEKEAQEEGQQALDALISDMAEAEARDDDEVPDEVPDEVWNAVASGPASLRRVVAAVESTNSAWDVGNVINEVVRLTVRMVREIDAAQGRESEPR
ncbi:hypothetical protein [Lentzea sp. CC55]|uniref:hypothetical protein n=1 Tax=Lentzea sp. CC55 TaxID=2884909 RepID=UPI001F212A82|nr:hypothetical protein [Lentzea sp. CC55]MCG8926631.1 hypothetical protein [Lentzea sp. CC55]